MLFAVGAGLLGFLAIAFSLTFLVVQFGSTTYTPRLNLFYTSPRIWHGFGFITGVLVFAFAAAYSETFASASGEARRRRMSGLVPIVMIALLMGAIVVYRNLQMRAFGSVELGSVLAEVTERGRQVLDGVYADELPRDADGAPQETAGTRSRRSPRGQPRGGVARALRHHPGHRRPAHHRRGPQRRRGGRDRRPHRRDGAPEGDGRRHPRLRRPVAGRGGGQGDPDRDGAHLRAGPDDGVPRPGRHRPAGAVAGDQRPDHRRAGPGLRGGPAADACRPRPRRRRDHRAPRQDARPARPARLGRLRGARRRRDRRGGRRQRAHPAARRTPAARPGRAGARAVAGRRSRRAWTTCTSDGRRPKRDAGSLIPGRS